MPKPDDIWERYKSSKDPKLKENILKKWIPYVRWVAERFVAFLPQSLDYEDITSQGILGLIRAIDSFDPSRGVDFKTYAFYRIKGAILDELRIFSRRSRTQREKSKRLESTYSTLEQRFGRMPTEEELKEELGLSEDEFHKFLMEARNPQLLSLDGWLDEKHKVTLETIAEEKGADILYLIQKEEVKEKLVKAVNGLADRERLLITLYYYEDMTLKEIAQVMGLTESRMSQIHTQVILHLKNYLKKLI